MAIQKTKKPKKKSVSQLHRLVWRDFSEYIRLRDCLRTTGYSDIGRCITCNAEFPFSQLQAGHFISRGRKSTLYDERNCAAQCFSCNAKHIGNGRQFLFGLAIDGLYGKGVAEEIERRSRELKQFKSFELEELREEIKKKTTDLLANARE